MKHRLSCTLSRPMLVILLVLGVMAWIGSIALYCVSEPYWAIGALLVGMAFLVVVWYKRWMVEEYITLKNDENQSYDLPVRSLSLKSVDDLLQRWERIVSPSSKNDDQFEVIKSRKLVRELLLINFDQISEKVDELENSKLSMDLLHYTLSGDIKILCERVEKKDSEYNIGNLVERIKQAQLKDIAVKIVLQRFGAQIPEKLKEEIKEMYRAHPFSLGTIIASVGNSQELMSKFFPKGLPPYENLSDIPNNMGTQGPTPNNRHHQK